MESLRTESRSLPSSLLSGTRREVVLLLRAGPKTVRSMAEVLDLTRNAIRSQLSKLERDGLVKVVARRPTKRKPEHVYGLTEDAEQLFPKSYDAVLNALLSVLAEERDSTEMNQLLGEVGRRLAWIYKPHQLEESPVDRIERARHALQDMGGLPNVRKNGDTVHLEGVSCPIASIVEAHGKRACDLARALLEELTELPVERSCEVESGCANCRFTIQLSKEYRRRWT